MGSSRDRWITPFALTVVGLGVAAIFIGPQIAKGSARTAMIDSCKSAVATWAGVDVGTLSDRDATYASAAQGTKADNAVPNTPAGRAALAATTELNAAFAVKRRMVVIGNSITNMMNADAADFKVKIDNRVGVAGGEMAVVGTPNYGVAGDTTSGAQSRLNGMIAAEHPSIIATPVSVNDVKTAGLSRSGTVGAIRHIVGMARLAGALPVVYLDPPLDPVKANVTDSAFTWASEHEKRIRDEIIRRDGLRAGYTVVDVPAAFARNDTSASGDGIHPTGTTTSGYGGIDVMQTTIADGIGCTPATVYGWQYLLNTFVSSNDPAESSLVGTWDSVTYNTTATDHTAISTCTGAPGIAYDASVVTRYAAGYHYLALLEVAADRSAALKFYKVAAGPTATQIGATITFVAGTFGDTARVELASIGTTHTIRVGTDVAVTFEGSTFTVSTGLITASRITDATYTAGTFVGVEKIGNALTCTNLTAYK